MLRNLYRQLVEKLTRKYRIEIIDDITLSQSRQFALKPITVIVLSMLLFVSIVAATASLIIFTPGIRKNIPGYLDPQYTEQQNKLLDRLTLIERSVREKDTIIKSLRLLAGLEEDSLATNLRERLNQMPQRQPAPTQRTPAPPVSQPPSPSSEEASEAADPVQSQPAPPAQVVPVVKASQRSPLLHLFPPLKGENRKGFNPEAYHYGVDIVADEGAVIHATADGFVVVSEFSDESGLMMTIQSEGDVLSIYKHNSRLLKEVGDYVYAGEPIAIIGNSGENTTGSHLHFELWYRGQAIDPVNYIQFH